MPDFEGHGHLNSITRMRSAVFYAARLFDRRKQIRGPAVALWGALLLSAGLRLTGVAPSVAGEADPARQDLDHIAYAVAGAESSHGTNPAMWRPNLAGPQGPMQVSEKAARDVGGGDRFDIAQNRAIGRAYLALLYRRYANWPDAVSAYNWGIGKFDDWIQAGRPSQKLVPAVAMYSRRVLIESGLCASAGRDCTLNISRAVAPYGRIGYRGARPTSASDVRVMAGLEHSGQVLARLAASGDPFPRLVQSGTPLPSLEQSGRPLSRRRASEVSWR